MDELTLTSHLSEEEISKNFQDINFFSGVMDGLQEALALKKGADMDDDM